MNQRPSAAPSAALLFLFTGSVLLGAVGFAATSGTGKISPIRVNVDYLPIDSNPPFRAKVNLVAFNFPNSGIAKVDADEQVIGVQFAVWNPGEQDLKVYRGHFFLNAARFDLFVVKEKTSQGLVVTVPAGKAVGITNYYVLGPEVNQLKHLDPSYSRVNKSSQKINVRLPVIKGAGGGPATTAESTVEKIPGTELGPKCTAFLAQGNLVCNDPSVKKYGQKYVDRCLEPYEKTAMEGNESKCALMTSDAPEQTSETATTASTSDAQTPTSVVSITVPTHDVPMEEISDAAMGYRIRVPVGYQTLRKKEYAHTFSLVLPGGLYEYNVNLTSLGVDSMDEAVHTATLVGGSKLADRKVLGNGYWVVKSPQATLQEIWVFKNGEKGSVHAKCTGPAGKLAVLIDMCASLQVTK